MTNIDDITGAWDYATLPPNVSVGKGCFLESKGSFGRFRSLKQPGLVIGAETAIYTWTTFNVEPSAFVEIGERCVLVGAVLMCADRITIGNDVVISYQVTIADSDFHPHNPEERRRDAVANAPFGNRLERPTIESRSVTIEDGAWIGIGAIVLKGVRVGRGARVGPGSVVVADVAPGTLVLGNPARIVEGKSW